jgi:hypothetical protein
MRVIKRITLRTQIEWNRELMKYYLKKQEVYHSRRKIFNIEYWTKMDHHCNKVIELEFAILQSK